MKTIRFSELSNYNDCNSIVIAGVNVDGMTIEEIDSIMRGNWGLLKNDKHVTGMAKITGNVNGEDGRTDILFELSGDDCADPMVRMRLRMSGLGVMWTSDFIDNYSRDYYTD